MLLQLGHAIYQLYILCHMLVKTACVTVGTCIWALRIPSRQGPYPLLQLKDSEINDTFTLCLQGLGVCILHALTYIEVQLLCTVTCTDTKYSNHWANGIGNGLGNGLGNGIGNGIGNAQHAQHSSTNIGTDSF